MKRIEESHVDHGLTAAQIAHLFALFANRSAFFIETVELPENLGTVPCDLHGPAMGDTPVTDTECHYATRGKRDGQSRLCLRSPRQVSTVTVIAGPNGADPCVLYTAFGGPLAPKEPWDVVGDALAESTAFWAEHALSCD